MTHPRVVGAAAGRILVAVLILSLSSQSVLGAEPNQNTSPDTPASAPNLKTSIARAAEALALAQTSSGTGKNKYFWPVSL